MRECPEALEDAKSKGSLLLFSVGAGQCMDQVSPAFDGFPHSLDV